MGSLKLEPDWLVGGSVGPAEGGAGGGAGATPGLGCNKIQIVVWVKRTHWTQAVH